MLLWIWFVGLWRRAYQSEREKPHRIWILIGLYWLGVIAFYVFSRHVPSWVYLLLINAAILLTGMLVSYLIAERRSTWRRIGQSAILVFGILTMVGRHVALLHDGERMTKMNALDAELTERDAIRSHLNTQIDSLRQDSLFVRSLDAVDSLTLVRDSILCLDTLPTVRIASIASESMWNRLKNISEGYEELRSIQTVMMIQDSTLRVAGHLLRILKETPSIKSQVLVGLRTCDTSLQFGDSCIRVHQDRMREALQRKNWY